MYEGWSDVSPVLKEFIWSETAFLSQVKSFWDETFLNPNNVLEVEAQ